MIFLNVLNVRNLWLKKSVRLSIRWLPKLFLKWQNRTLFHSCMSRLLRGSVLCILSALMVLGLWREISFLGWVSSDHQASILLEQDVKALIAKVHVRQTENNASTTERRHHLNELIEVQAEMDDLMVAWPNSNFRTVLLNHLQQLSQQHGLAVMQLKSAKLPDHHGYEASSVQFSLKGAEGATFSFWQSVNRLLPNGVWTHVSWRALPDGLFALEGQINLLWDAQDADTDTGVEMKWRHQAAQNPQALKFQSHVLPDHPQAQMRMVGSVGSSHTSTPAASWAFIRSGNQIHAVQAGQYLGLEKVKVHSTDSKGLWLGGDEGQAPSLMAWELIKP